MSPDERNTTTAATAREVTPFALRVHHVRLAVDDVTGFSHFLAATLGFSLFARKSRSGSGKEDDEEVRVFRHGAIVLLVQPRRRGEERSADDEELLCGDWHPHTADTAYDVCLECSDVRKITDNSTELGSTISHFKQVSDKHGIVEFARIRSPVGNLVHTLVDTSRYCPDRFLPGFEPATGDDNDRVTSPSLIHVIDHVALCVPCGETDGCVEWYKKTFGFKRVLINQDDSAVEGFKVKMNSNGMVIKEVVCPYVAQQTTYVSEVEDSSCVQSQMTRFVFTEPLTNEGNQTALHQFIKDHGCAGIQHLAFGCDDLFSASSTFTKSGLDCVDYPAQYYIDLAKCTDHTDFNIDIDRLRENKALLEFHNGDDEALEVHGGDFLMADLAKQMETIQHSKWYIMQVFSRPNVFKERTLFFEIIQRYNTLAGLGASNIATIWKYWKHPSASVKRE